jgi:calcineurin-like phosphoesterase family protein
MGDKEVETSGHGIAQSACAIIKFSGYALPAEYESVVYSKWLRTLKYENDYFRLCDRESFFAHFKARIGQILLRPDCIVRLAVLSDDHDVVMGWSVMQETVLHYVVVGFDYRNQGIMRLLVPMRPTTITSLTHKISKIWPAKFPDAIFNPFF